MTEVDPDPNVPAEEQGRATLGGRDEPGQGDPTEGGKRGQVGEAPSVASDEPSEGSYAPGGGTVTEESDAAPVADPGPDA